MNIEKSQQFLARMSEFVPGGASSNVRTRNAIAVSYGKGGELFDLDGNRYIDYILGFGPILLGHGHSAITQSVTQAMNLGTTFAFTTESEFNVCKKIVELSPSVEMVRLCNSGTDAGVTAYRIACVYTGASIAVKIQGDYNGGFDVLAHDVPGVDGDYLDQGPMPIGKGFVKGVGDLIITIPFNDADALEKTLQTYRGKIAVVFMEPILGNVAGIMPQPGYLQTVRDLCTQHGVVLVFDEVKTGFRVALGGAQSLFGVHSDLTMYGKALANGLPLAAIGGKQELMELVTPGKVFHCGTFYGNLVSTSAAEAVLGILTKADYVVLMQRGENLAKGICDRLIDAGIPARWNGVGAMFGITIGADCPTDYKSWWQQTNRKLWMDVSAIMRNLGILSDDFIGLFFLSFAHTDEHIKQTLQACEEAIYLYKKSEK
jgi:glutamate-1-semialdehyde 2,1-aminomutase